MNIILLSKIAWRIISQPKSLLARVFKSKYEKDRGWWNECKAKNTSYTWKGILIGLKTLDNKVRWSVGSGQRIRIGIDPWVLNIDGFIPRINLRFQLCLFWPVVVLGNSNATWNIDLVRELFILEDVEKIVKLYLPLADRM